MRARMQTEPRTGRRTDKAARRAAPLGGPGRVALVAALAAASAASDAQAQQDRWSSPDKALHFGVSAPFGALGAAFAPKDAGTAQRLFYGAVLGSLPGLAKEVSDFRRPDADASTKDMALNVLGAAFGALVADCCLIRPIARGDRVDGVGIEYRVDF
jgi:putative lipoprotein